jgi:hypothetical protein
MTTPFEEIVKRLGGVNGQMARCPAHDDSNPSLSVSEGADGRVLLHCHAGCTAEEVVDELGLTMADLFPDQGRRPGGRDMVKTFPYTDENGDLLFEVVRYLPKDFRQRRPDGRGGWVWSLGDVRRVLYRLPEVVAAVKEDTRIFVVEGERDADTLVSSGCCATTNPGGAGRWRPEYGEVLRGAGVVILPDNDGPGRRHARQVARHLHGVAAWVKVVTLPAGKDVTEWFEVHGGTLKELARLRRAAPEWEPVTSIQSGTPDEDQDEDEAGSIAAPDDDRPRITISTEEHEVNDRAVEALAADAVIYQRGGILVRVVRDLSPAAAGIRRPFAPRIDPLPPPVLRERLAANARWLVEREIKGVAVLEPAHPPGWCVSAVHARAGWHGVRHLEAVVDYPVLRPDGTVLCTPGYDADTGLLLVPAGPLPPIPASPSRRDARAACAELLEVVADFPFQRAEHKAAWLAALLTPLARFAFAGPAPLFLVDANVRGSGKGLMLHCIALIITGEPFVVATYTDDEDELRKRITSLAIAGDRLVLFDNLAGKFGNATLDAALTGISWRDRVLGGNRMAEAPLYMTWFATGNNVVLGGDTPRRVCHVRLESPDENPEQRDDFRHPNLLRWVKGHRARLLAAALTVLRGYCVAGRPDQGLPTWGSYEGWSGLVRAAVVWVGLPDPGATRLLLQEHADVAASAMAVLLAGWEQMDPDRRGLTAAEVVKKLQREDRDLTFTPPSYYADMRGAI